MPWLRVSPPMSLAKDLQKEATFGYLIDESPSRSDTVWIKWQNCEMGLSDLDAQSLVRAGY
jgi:hypothetical protein